MRHGRPRRPSVARARAFLTRPPTHVRLNPRIADAEGPVAEAGVAPVAHGRAGRLARPTAAPRRPRREGVLYVQDAGSQLVAHLAAERGRVLDACAAPAARPSSWPTSAARAPVVAAEVSPRRLATMTCLRAPLGGRNVRSCEPTRGVRLSAGAFDSVLLDAPCSGLGTLARNPDIRWRRPRGPPPAGRAPARDARELATLVRPGAVSSTRRAAPSPRRPTGVLRPFLAAHPEFPPERLPDSAGPFADGRFVCTDPARHRARCLLRGPAAPRR